MNRKYKATIILSICGLFLFYKYISQLFPSLISVTLIEQYKLTGIEIGVLASSYYYSYSIMQIFAGVMLDKYSVRISAFLALLITSLGIIGFTHTDSFFMMCVYRALMGIGCSFATILYLKCAASYTSLKAFGFVSSLLATATMLGAAAGAAPIALVFESTGWKQGLDYIAMVGFALCVLSLIFVKVEKSGEKSQTINFSRMKEVVLNPANAWLLFYSGITFSPIIVMGGLWGVPFLALKFNMAASSAAVLISIMFVGHALGSPVWALINAKINSRKKLMVFANSISFICINLILFAPIDFNVAAFLCFCFGFSVGCFMLSFEFCREINGVALMGIAVAFINSGEGLVGVILEPGIGLVLDLVKAPGASEFSMANYQLGLSILPLCYIVSTLLVQKLPQRNTKIKYEENIEAVTTG